MTDTSDLISWHNWIYVTYSRRGDQTAHASIKIVKMSGFQQLMMPLLDSENLNYRRLSSLARWMTGNSELISRNNLIYVRCQHTICVKISVFQQLMEPLLDSETLEKLKFWHDSGQALRTTGNRNPISWQNWIYATYSGRGDQTAHTSVEIDKISRLD